MTMLIPLKPLVDQYKMKITGVIHVGAHWGQEFEAYQQNGVSQIIFIEPAEAAFKRLTAMYGHLDNVHLIHCACAEEDGSGLLYVEEHNQGQSNSLLKPRRHLQHYPQIVFDQTELVPVRTLDSITFHKELYNFLMMDTQGAELLVLKGAKETLPHIDYIYTEVNEQELYEGNAMVSELDQYLPDFKRVETLMTGQGWGDAVYIRRSLLENQL